ncbi:MAG: vitamin K epoxide reductase family protein [Bacteroidota bacterium]
MQNDGPNSSIIPVAIGALTKLSIPFSFEYVEEFLKGHKDYPSLSSLAALLDDFNINQVGVRISSEQLMRITAQCVAYIKVENEERFVLIESKVTNRQVSYFDPVVGMVTETLTDFEKKWSGVALLMEADHLSNSRSNDEFAKKTRKKWSRNVVCVILLFLILTSLVFNPGFEGILIPIIALKIIGTAISLMLIFNDIGMSTTISDKFCTLGGISNKVGCNKVSESKASSFFGIIRMSEIGLFYFVGGLIYTIVSLLTETARAHLGLLFVLTIASLPYTFFSIYYQVFVVKQLCSLCIATMVVIWLEFFTMFFGGVSISMNLISVPFALPAIFSYSLTILFWFAFKGQISEGSTTRSLRKKLGFFLHSGTVINETLSVYRSTTLLSPLHPIKINSGGNCEVIVVLSLFCVPCSKMLSDVIRIAKRFTNVEFNIIIHIGDQGAKVVSKNLLTHKLSAGDEAAIEYLKNWYGKTIESLTEKAFIENYERYKVETEEIVNAWINWGTVNDVRATPTVYINKSHKPNFLSLDDFEALFRFYSKKALD